MSNKILVMAKQSTDPPIFDSSLVSIQSGLSGTINKTFPGEDSSAFVQDPTTIEHNLGYRPMYRVYLETPEGLIRVSGFYFYKPPGADGTTRSWTLGSDKEITVYVRGTAQAPPIPTIPKFDYKIHFFIVDKKVSLLSNNYKEDTSLDFTKGV